MITQKVNGYVTKSKDTPCRIPIKVELVFDPETDPFAVQMIIANPDGGDDIVWVFAQSLLASGMLSTEPVGHGDVKLHTSPAYSLLHVLLDNSDGHAELALHGGPVRAFIAKTAGLIPDPKDIESHIDELIEEILNG